MNKPNAKDFKGSTQLWLDYTLSVKFFEIFKENTRYTSYMSFCLSIFTSLKQKKDRGLFHITRVMVSFNKVSGFSDELSLEYIIDYLENRRYENFYEIAKLEYKNKNKNN